MPKFIKRHTGKTGTPPGTLVHIGEQKQAEAVLSLIDYDPDHCHREIPLPRIEDAFPLKDRPSVTWINVDGLHDLALIEKIGRHFDIHPLTLEDIVNTGHRPKVEFFDHYIYVVLKMLYLNEALDDIRSEQVSLILGPSFLVSFQESSGDVFAPVRERIRKPGSRIRASGCDYLAYALIDAVVDHYFLILEKTGDRIEVLEEQLMEETDADTLQHIHDLKREMIFMRKQVWPIRELVGSLLRDESDLISSSTRVFLRDVYDHAVQVIDTIESYRDILSGLVDLYMSSVSHRMNEVMKVLTIIATIFIPITFIAGIYGMNFEMMPELKWRWGYAGVWGVMIVVVLVMVGYFRRKKWL